MEEQVQNQDAVEEKVPEVTDFTDDRASQIEAMAAARDERIKDEHAPVDEGKDWEGDPGEKPDETPPAKDDEPDQEPEKPAPDPEPETVTVKVDGVESQVALAEVEAYGGVVPYQIHKAAENRLTEARKVLGEAKSIRAESQKPEEKPKTTEEIQGQLVELSKKALEATDAEEFAAVELEKAKLYREMFQAEFAERDRTNQLLQAHQAQQKKYEALTAKVAEKHSDFETLLWSAPNQDGIRDVQPRLEQWLLEQPASTRWALLESEDPSDPIGVFDRYKADTGLVQVESMELRKDRKRDLDPPPTATKKVVKPKTEDKEETPAQVVAQMRKDRGLETEEYL